MGSGVQKDPIALPRVNNILAILIFLNFHYDFQKLIFGEGGEIFTLWKNPPVDIYIKIYLWNITNSDSFLEGKEKMHVEEVGPYVYRYLHKNHVLLDIFWKFLFYTIF